MTMEMPEIIESTRLILKKPETTFAFATELYAIVENNRDHFLPWLDWATPDNPLSVEKEFTFLQASDTNWESGTVYNYFIFDKEHHKTLGSTSLFRRHQKKDCHFEIAYWLTKDATGHGYMLEAVRALEQKAFELGTERLIIRNDVENTPSVNIARRLNYTHECVMRHDHYNAHLKMFRDTNLFAKIKG